MLSSAVLVREAPSAEDRAIAALRGVTLTAQMPSESEMRDAVAQCSRDLQDMLEKKNAGGVGWTAVDGAFAFKPVTDPDGTIAIRGYLVIERA